MNYFWIMYFCFKNKKKFVQQVNFTQSDRLHIFKETNYCKSFHTKKLHPSLH